jgi:hypothetical protein
VTSRRPRTIRPTRIALTTLLVLAVLSSVVGVAFAAFSSTTTNPTSSFAAANDWTPPSASSSVIVRQNGGVAGYVKQGGNYHVYANVSDTGNPASGTATVTANTSTFDSGVTAAALASGSYTVAGATYNWRSAVLTANAAVTPGSYNYTLALADNDTNAQTQNGFSVIFDNTVPSASDIQTTNVGGGTSGKPESGDTVIYTFSEQMDPTTIKANWDGTSTAVTVNFNQNAPRDTLTTSVNLGTIDLANNGWVSANATFNATMVMSGSTVTITLGSLASGSVNTVTNNLTFVWTPVNTATDRAGNAMSTTARNETGAADRDF